MENELKFTNNESNDVYHHYDVFAPGGGNYLWAKRMYRFCYNEIPSCLSIDHTNVQNLVPFIQREFSHLIQNEVFDKEFTQETKKLETTKYVCFLENKILLCTYLNTVFVLYNTESEAFAMTLYKQIKRFARKQTTEISLIISKENSLQTKELHIKKPKIDLKSHYNEDFPLVHQKIITQLNSKNTNGLFLFHGVPGTGKTTYIKYLIHSLKKKVIFLSPKMAGTLDNHSMTELLIENKNSVLVIEDAEELITSRDTHFRNSNLSMILNMTDGLLGEGLGIQIIATFNTELKNIDKALLRKGRLQSIYEFKPLSSLKTNQLLHSLGHQTICLEPMTVAD